MKTTIRYKHKDYQINLAKPLDISMPLRGTPANVNAWYVPPPRIEPHQEGEFVGKVSEGATINFNDVCFNPHAHGTHTECLGHLTEDFFSVNDLLKEFFFLAQLVTIAPEKMDGDFVISQRQLQYALKDKECQAVVIRTLPNTTAKINRQYSHTNPPYLLEEAAVFLRDRGVAHLLVDLPSVDREKDDGELLAHRAFWDFDGHKRFQSTITELIFVPNAIVDGAYFLNLQVAPLHNDASPSRPVLFQIKNS